MGVHRRGAGKTRPCTRAATDGLVVLIACIAKSEIVHRPLARRQNAERAVKRVSDDLTGLHIAGNHRSGAVRRQHATVGDNQLQRHQTTLVKGNVVVHQSTKNIKYGRTADGDRRIEVRIELRRGAREVDARTTFGVVHIDRHLDYAAVV